MSDELTKAEKLARAMDNVRSGGRDFNSQLAAQVSQELRAQAERIKTLESAAMDRLVAEGQRCGAMTPQEAAKVLLAAVDAFMSGEKLTEEQRELERTAVIAGAFAGGAYDRYWPKGGGEYHALTRVFLLALIDPDHAELDYLRTDPSAGQTARDARAALRAISEDSHE